MSLKPIFKPACPECDFTLKYYVWDPQTHPDTWVMTAESLAHLDTPHPKEEVKKPVLLRGIHPEFKLIAA